MDAHARHERVWRILQALMRPYLHRHFALTSEPCRAEGPCIVIPNHVTNWDPFLVAMSFPRKQLYYVASEHIFRLPVLSGVIRRLLDPIARRKGDTGADAVKVFPADSLGSGYIKAVSAPLGHIPLMAVGGVNEKNAADYMKAGCVGLGVGGNLVNKEWIENGEWDKVTALAREFMKAVKEA